MKSGGKKGQYCENDGCTTHGNLEQGWHCECTTVTCPVTRAAYRVGMTTARILVFPVRRNYGDDLARHKSAHHTATPARNPVSPFRHLMPGRTLSPREIMHRRRMIEAYASYLLTRPTPISPISDPRYRSSVERGRTCSDTSALLPQAP